MTDTLAGLFRSSAWLALFAGMPVLAQVPQPSMQMAPGATPDADQLAAAMRRVGDNPRDLEALLTAGELSLRLGDASGAASLFKRAEAVDPMNGRVKAGMARILVTQERPGEALRYFDQATGYGLNPRSFAGDRGLAYDLIGEQERAQRDYRVALKAVGAGPAGDEVRRRYALSLGISGRREAALEQIEPLVRRNDRGAWRARAFILAMTGDVPGANTIATTMMPGGMAQGLLPFFARLPALRGADRAFAVHFGEVSPTAERIADARLAPTLPVLGPDPDAPVAVAAIRLPEVKVPEPSRRERRRRGRERVEVAKADVQPVVAAAVAAPVPRPAAISPAAPRPSPPPSTAPARPALVETRPAPVQTASTSRSVPGPGFADASPAMTIDLMRGGRPAPRRQPVAAATARPVPSSPPTPARASTQVAAAPVAPTNPIAAAPRPAEAQVATSVVAAAPVEVVASPPTALPVAAPPPASEPEQLASLPASPSPAEAVVTPAPVATASVPPAAVVPGAPVAPGMSEDSILASIVKGIPIPGSELGVDSPPASDPAPAAVPVPVPVQVAQAPVEAPPPASEPRAAQPAAEKRTGDAGPRARIQTAAASPKPAPSGSAKRQAEAPEPDEAEPRKGRRGTALAKADTKAKGDAKAKADPKADAKTAAAEKADKKAADKKLADKKTRAKPEPKEEPRIWVQVAGGAHEGDLPKAWASVKSKAPALARRDGYATPLRATNRVVTGPFKTEAEAQALVNQLTKQGVSAFTFKSAVGQKVTRLPGK